MDDSEKDKHLYDLAEPPHSFAVPPLVVSHRGLIVKREAARYFLLLYKLGVGGINPDMKYFISRFGRLTLNQSERWPDEDECLVDPSNDDR